MGSNHMHDHFRRLKEEKEQEKLNEEYGITDEFLENIDEMYKNKQKFPIPEYDPQTGERNPYYEELTGKKHPEDIDKEKK